MLKNKITVVIADDHPLIRSGVRKIFEQTQDILVVGEASNGLEAIELVEKLCPDVLLLDIQMPIMDGIQALTSLCEKQAKVIIFIVSAMNDDGLENELLAKGARGYYLKEHAPTHIVNAIYREISEDEKGFRPEISKNSHNIDGLEIAPVS